MPNLLLERLQETIPRVTHSNTNRSSRHLTTTLVVLVIPTLLEVLPLLCNLRTLHSSCHLIRLGVHLGTQCNQLLDRTIQIDITTILALGTRPNQVVEGEY